MTLRVARKSGEEGRSSAWRRLIAGVLAVLFLLHASPLVVASTSSAGHIVPGETASLCSIANDEGAPAPSHQQSHKSSCLFCCCRHLFWAACAASPVYLVVLGGRPAGRETAVIPEDAPRHPLGWVSAWSSRAPPSFS